MAERALLRSAWRRWEQAAQALDEADEAEEFQAVGARCRESLIAMIKSLARPEMVPAGQEAPKRADVKNWCDLIANHVAHGGSASEVRGYLKAISASGWQLVAWLVHSGTASRADGEIAISVPQHILGTFGAAVFRLVSGIPDRCPDCGSYKIGLRRPPDTAPDAEARPTCQACGWIATPAD